MTDPEPDVARPRDPRRPEDETDDPGQQHQTHGQLYASGRYPGPPPGAVAQQPGRFRVPQQEGPLPPPPVFTAKAAAPASAPPATVAASAPVAAQPPDAASIADPAAQRLAAPAVTAAPLASQSAMAASALASTSPEDSGPPSSDGGAPAEAEARAGRAGKMSRLRVGWHTITRASLTKVNVTPTAASGLILGRDRQHTAVPLRLFAPNPMRITLVGGAWAAQLIIFRAFSLGARVAVLTREPQAWSGFGERATGQHNRLRVLSGDQGVSITGTAQTPTLAVYDLGMTGPVGAAPLGPWCAQLTVLRQLDRPGVPALQDAQLTLLQRLGGDEAALASSALRLRPHSSQFLQFMADDMVALIDEGTDRYLFLAQTDIEQQHVGMPRR